jgi:hypothetical protein
MWPFDRVRKPSPKRVADLENELGDVQLAVAWCKKAIIDLNARMATIQRQEKRAEVAPEATNEEGEVPQDLPRQPQLRPASTAHLARRFRGG